jgi:hypothetical protein
MISTLLPGKDGRSYGPKEGFADHQARSPEPLSKCLFGIEAPIRLSIGGSGGNIPRKIGRD